MQPMYVFLHVYVCGHTRLTFPKEADVYANQLNLYPGVEKHW